MEGRKIVEHYENPIDNVLIALCDPASVFLRKFNVTPNQITTVGMFIGISAFYSILKRRYKTAFLLFWLSYYFDCLDGYYARKYNMVTTFGDYYDHIRDVVVIALVVGATYYKLSKKHKTQFIAVMTILTALLCVHAGCQERNSNTDKHNDCLGLFKPLCKNRDVIHLSKYFGFGTFMTVISLYILSLQASSSRSHS